MENTPSPPLSPPLPPVGEESRPEAAKRGSDFHGHDYSTHKRLSGYTTGLHEHHAPAFLSEERHPPPPANLPLHTSPEIARCYLLLLQVSDANNSRELSSENAHATSAYPDDSGHTARG